MTAGVPTLREERKWYYLSLRHLRMAFRLERMGFVDGAVFHAYHTYECALSALIAARGYPVPPDGQTRHRLPSGKTIRVYPSPMGMIQDTNAHKVRIIFFDELADPTKSYYVTHTRLKRMLTYQDRINALYYDPVQDRLPEDRYRASFATGLLSSIRQFVKDIRAEIH